MTQFFAWPCLRREQRHAVTKNKTGHRTNKDNNTRTTKQHNTDITNTDITNTDITNTDTKQRRQRQRQQQQHQHQRQQQWARTSHHQIT